MPDSKRAKNVYKKNFDKNDINNLNFDLAVIEVAKLKRLARPLNIDPEFILEISSGSYGVSCKFVAQFRKISTHPKIPALKVF